MSKKLALLIHGPLSGHMLERIGTSLQSFEASGSRFDSIVVVAYEHELPQYQQTFSNLLPQQSPLWVSVKDVVNPGFGNVNRQISTVRAGLEALSEDCLVLKLRNDQVVDFVKVCAQLDKGDIRSSRKLLTTNCFTRRDRLYHPSDMFMAAQQPVLKAYFDAPLMTETDLDVMYQERARQAQSSSPYGAIRTCPESYLFRSFLKREGWQLQETVVDSEKALRTYIFVANSWQIDYCWAKKRTPFVKAGGIILPHYFTIEPFEGAPLERARCHHQSFFTGESTPQDWGYAFLSWLVFTGEIVPLKCKRTLRRAAGRAYRGAKKHVLPSLPWPVQRSIKAVVRKIRGNA